MPGLKRARAFHSSCATDKAVFVFGGSENKVTLDTFERLTLVDEYDSKGQILPYEWSQFTIVDLKPGAFVIMAALSNEAIIVLGGSSLWDGVIFSPEWNDGHIGDTKMIKCNENVFLCSGNQCCVTEQGKLIALVADSDQNLCLIEVSDNGKSINSLKSYGHWKRA